MIAEIWLKINGNSTCYTKNILRKLVTNFDKTICLVGLLDITVKFLDFLELSLYT